jgi:hypothetical protein
MNVAGLKKEYNLNLSRHYKAERYFNNSNISMLDKEQHIEDYKEVVLSLNNIVSELSKCGVVCTLEGFKEV